MDEGRKGGAQITKARSRTRVVGGWLQRDATFRPGSGAWKARMGARPAVVLFRGVGFGADKFPLGVVGFPDAGFLAGEEPAGVVEGAIFMVAFPEAGRLTGFKGAGLHQLPVFAIPFPWAREFAAGVFSGRAKPAVSQVVFPSAGF